MIRTNGKRFAVYADCDSFNRPIDMHSEMKAKNVIREGQRLQVTASSEMNAVGNRLDWLNWLPWAAKKYNVSADPQDYILLPTIICPSDIPNRNGVGFPMEELLAFDLETHRQVYQNWKGCPTFVEHDNEDPGKAKGMVVDVAFRMQNGVKGRLGKVLGFAAFDRTRDPALGQRLLTRQVTDVSMGTYVNSYTCSVCHAEFGMCRHMDKRSPRNLGIDPQTGKLIYRRCHGLTPFELSSVATPAWSVAESPHVIDLKNNVAYR